MGLILKWDQRKEQHMPSPTRTTFAITGTMLDAEELLLELWDRLRDDGNDEDAAACLAIIHDLRDARTQLEERA